MEKDRTEPVDLEEQLEGVYRNLFIREVFYILLDEQNTVTVNDIESRCNRLFPAKVTSAEEIESVLEAEGLLVK